MAIKHDLRKYIELLVQKEAAISEIYLFGSRAYGTGSLRSDCDLIVRSDPNKPTKLSALRTFAVESCTALDFFLCTEARATSAANDSSVHAADFTALVSKLDALLLWTRVGGFVDFAFRDTSDWTFEVAKGIDFKMTVMPDASWADMVWSTKRKTVEDRGLPIQPYIGDTLDKAVGQIVDVIRRMAVKASDLGQNGVAKSGWTANLDSEYDCQNLFFTVVKPWLVSPRHALCRLDDVTLWSSVHRLDAGVLHDNPAAGLIRILIKSPSKNIADFAKDLSRHADWDGSTQSVVEH